MLGSTINDETIMGDSQITLKIKLKLMRPQVRLICLCSLWDMDHYIGAETLNAVDVVKTPRKRGWPNKLWSILKNGTRRSPKVVAYCLDPSLSLPHQPIKIQYFGCILMQIPHLSNINIIAPASIPGKEVEVWDWHLEGHHGARWPSGLERWTGDRVVLGSNAATATSLRNFGNSVYPALPVSFGGDTKSRRSLLSGVSATAMEVKDPTSLHWKCATPSIVSSKCNCICLKMAAYRTPDIGWQCSVSQWRRLSL